MAHHGRNKLRDLIESESPAERTLSIARAFVSARQRAVPLADYPGPLPPDMEAGYAVQEAAIGLWPDRIVGWKIGLVPPSQQATLGTSRLAGPIFLQGVTRVAGAVPEPVRLAAIAGGFAAIEAELVVAARADAPVGKTQWTLEEAAAFAGDWHLGVEFAASPLATINELGLDCRKAAWDSGQADGLGDSAGNPGKALQKDRTGQTGSAERCLLRWRYQTDFPADDAIRPEPIAASCTA